MENLKFIQPYSDEFLTWNSKTNKYELTMSFVREELEINFKDDGVLEKRLKRNSKIVYSYLKNNTYVGNITDMETLLNKTEQGREFLKEVLLEQFDADNDTGYNDLTKQPAINLATGQVMDRNELIRNQIAVSTEQLIDNNAQYFGFNICVMFRYPPYLQLELTRR